MKKLFQKGLYIFFTLQLFTVCTAYAGVTEFMEKALNSWVGYNIDDIINTWGFPNEEKNIANRHIFIWNKTWSQYIPQNTNSTITPNYYNATVHTYTTGGYSINMYCNKTIEVDERNNIISWSWEGNACPKNYRNGKSLVNPLNNEWEREKIKKLEEKQLQKAQKAQKKSEKKQAKELKQKEKQLQNKLKQDVTKEVSATIK